jgi:predicted ATP-dependent endonuclease of OLD family
MRLQRVQIPNFRVLKDIDIIFEDYHVPQTFLLASQNGGGKSTFLQLIFVLLKGCYSERGGELIRNLLKNSNLDNSLWNSSLSTITLTDGGENIKLEIELRTYDLLCENYLSDLNTSANESLYNILKKDGIDGVNNYIKQLEEKVTILKERYQMEDEARSGFLNLMKDKNRSPLLTEIIAHAVKESVSSEGSGVTSPEEMVLDQANRSIKKIEKEIVNIEGKIQPLNVFLSEFNSILISKRIRVVHNSQNTCLIYKFSGDKEFLDLVDLSKKISECIFMAAPSSQTFLFLSPEELNSLFENSSEYYSILKQKQEAINNLFLFELSLVKTLANIFKVAFDNDRLKALKNGGEYGNELKLVLNDLKDFLHGKTIQPSSDMSRVVVKMKDINNLDIELSPADLSHGELRQLSLYAWLKIGKVKNSIVLVDEIEIALHPDWQYQIVRDLEKWEPSNQYILATHSYDVCSALSPSHVKEIEPKLMKSEIKIAQ